MTAAAFSSPGDHTSDLLEELYKTLRGFDALPSAAQLAVASVAESILQDNDLNLAEVRYLNVLHAHESNEGRVSQPSGRGTRRRLKIEVELAALWG
jgi:hypothetical protein